MIKKQISWSNKKMRDELILNLSDENYKQNEISKILNPSVSQSTISNTIKTRLLKPVVEKVLEYLPMYSDVNTVYEDMSIYSAMVIDGYKKALLITGMSGMGKTYTVLDELDKRNKVIDEDYCLIKGKVTPQGLYTILYENRYRLLVFDDSDSIWEKEETCNMLKHALDTNGQRSINWISQKEIKNPNYSTETADFEIPYLPSKFDYNGSIIFVSNKFKSQLDTAVLTRTLKIDLNLSTKDTLKRIENLLPNIRKEVNDETKKIAFDYLIELSEKYEIDISIRSYIDILDMYLYGNKNWKRLSLHQCAK